VKKKKKGEKRKNRLTPNFQQSMQKKNKKPVPIAPTAAIQVFEGRRKSREKKKGNRTPCDAPRFWWAIGRPIDVALGEGEGRKGKTIA